MVHHNEGLPDAHVASGSIYDNPLHKGRTAEQQYADARRNALSRIVGEKMGCGWQGADFVDIAAMKQDDAKWRAVQEQLNEDLLSRGYFDPAAPEVTSQDNDRQTTELIQQVVQIDSLLDPEARHQNAA